MQLGLTGMLPVFLKWKKEILLCKLLVYKNTFYMLPIFLSFFNV